jgi:HlyD family secretion protein
MSTRSLLQSSRALLPWIVLLSIATAIGVYFYTREKNPLDVDPTILLHSVELTDFEAFITEPGDVASSSNIEVRCRVRSRGSAGTSILNICDEGIPVKPGEFLLQFDDSVLQQDSLAQKIVVANDKAMFIQTKSNLDNATRTLREYTQGLFAQERDVLDTELFVAEENLQRAITYLQHSKRLNSRGYLTTTQLRGDAFAVEKSKKELAAAKRKLEVYDKFTQDKMVGEYEAEIKKQEANVEAATYTLQLSEQRLKEIDEQITACLVLAPAAGQVVHANERNGRENASVSEEGTLIRENQIVIRLPDLKNMQVDVKVNESHVNKIKIGHPARIILDADPSNILEGTVTEIAPYPFPIRWHGAPMEYGTVVTIINPPATIRPGLRAKVKIVFESIPNVMQVPLAAVIEQGKQHYCLVRERDGWRTQPVKIGSNNNDRVVVLEGLEQGDRVSMTPFEFIKRSELPTDEVPIGVARDGGNSQREKPANSNSVSAY